MAKPRRLRRRLIVGVVAVVIVVAAGTSAWALTTGSGASYRYAKVTRATVSQSLTTTGALSPIQSANLDFQVAGTVQKVLVKQGAHVKAGQTVARLDRSTLRATVASAKSTLSQARSALADAENDETSDTTETASDTAYESDSTGTTQDTTAGTIELTADVVTVKASPSATPSASPTSTSGSPGGTHPTSSPTSGGQSGGHSGGTSTIAADQAAVLAAQHQADIDLETAKAALTAEKKACASELKGTTSTAAATESCSQATTTLLADQTAVSKDQTAVSAAESALNTAIDKAASSTPSTSTSSGSSSNGSGYGSSGSTGSSGSSSSAGSSSRSGESSGSSSTATTVTAATLATDQATIDTDVAAVATAKQDLAQGVLTSPISGTVTAVTVSKGDSVSGSSSSTSPAFEVAGSKQSEVAIGLTASQVRTVKTGMQAHVTADGTTSAVTGSVVSVGLTETADDDTDYPVVIALSKEATSLVSGADAAVTLDLASAANVIAVPTSAVHHNGTSTYVERVKNGKLVHVSVKIGAVGAARTQITSGLTVGEQIVLANMKASVPSSSTNLTTAVNGSGGFTRGAGGGFGGGTAGGGGGFPAGAGGGFAGRTGG